jgi:FKBP-type peptidyl-prolyl cis-trans isomerase
MNRMSLLVLALLTVALAAAPGASAKAFVFPAVSKTLGQKPTIGPPHGAAPRTLKIKDVVVGSGATARAGDVVSTNYVSIVYRSGTEFDTSWGRQPFVFTLGRGEVIAGWDRGVRGMRVGGRRTLVIPARLAYGATGSPPSIPAHATLTFVVDLLAVKR